MDGDNKNDQDQSRVCDSENGKDENNENDQSRPSNDKERDVSELSVPDKTKLFTEAIRKASYTQDSQDANDGRAIAKPWLLENQTKNQPNEKERKKSNSYQELRSNENYIYRRDRSSQPDIIKSSATKPDIVNVTPESVLLSWKNPKRTEEVDYYKIKYKEVNATKWEAFTTKDKARTATVVGLKSSTKYHFKVGPVYDDEEGPFTDVSETVETKPSLAMGVLDFVRQQDRGKIPDHEDVEKPVKIKIPLTEQSINKHAKTRKCLVELSRGWKRGPVEKTIMLVGASGTGKTTFLDGIMNYVATVSLNDDFRFTVADHAHEKQKQKNQAVSKAEWITHYKIRPINGGRVNYTLNVIDTPGFGDYRGVERDKSLVEQIRELFATKGESGVDSIDAICFVTKAPLDCLTPTDRYISDSILSVFGKDIVSNIVIMVTFADGNMPPVVAALKAENVPFKEHFLFNNSALFAKETEESSTFFWDMNQKNFRTFFDHLLGMEKRSLTLTVEVLRERKQLEQTVNGLLPQVNKGLNKMEEIRRHRKLLDRYEREMMANENFKFKDKRTHDKRIDLEAGVHVTNCIHCHQTCHFPCFIPNNDNKANCAAMASDGHCTVCKQKCLWNLHLNNGYRIEMYEEEYEGTSEDLLQMYNVAKDSKDKTESLLHNMKAEMATICTEVHRMITESNRCLNRLKVIALKPDPLNDVKYIEQLIETERINGEAGFRGRIKSLEDIKKQAEVTTKVNEGTFKPFSDFDME